MVLALFSNIDSLVIGEKNLTDGDTFLAQDYFSGSMIGEETTLVYENGALTATGLIPEPTTATLSLLALAALAARRRRK